jgi:hypothetical protein
MFDLGISKLVGGKPTEIFERFIPDGISHAATSFVESLKINSLTEKTRRDRTVVIKRRNVYGERVAELINFYFRMADTGIRYVSDVGKWQRWETKCFQLLNGSDFRAAITGARAVTLDKMPGKSLWDHLNAGTLTPRMLELAGREYRRAHRMRVSELGDGWSHGDASMTNVIYDQKSHRARLIDFEIMHEKSLSPVARHADDLLVFLLDMVDRASARQWLPFSLYFLRAYDDGKVIRELRKRLVIPSGLALIWWNVRTNFAKSAKVNRRFQALRRAISDRLSDQVDGAAAPRHKRRPSISCQVTKPGIPKTSSRTRAISDRANAASPGIPRRLPITR